MPGTVVLIDNDRRTREVLSRCFACEGLSIIPAMLGQTGMTLVCERHPDAVLLEVNLPDIDGWSVLRRLRREMTPDLPVIMLTGRSELPDRIMGLDLGADDYIGKPFEPLEVLARIKAVCRRTSRCSPQRESLDFPGLSIDVPGFTVTHDGKPVCLSSREFKLLLTLAQHSQRVVTRRQLYEAGWEEDVLDDAHVLDVCVNRLRRKLLGARQYIRTVRGVGYKFVP
ncbi:MAG: response regulator transcription factor [Armatimonadota bacterium]